MNPRLKFFFKHLSCSLLIALIVVGIVFFVWYPTPLASAVGVTNIFWMLLIIDVILGPVLGFIVYKVGKKTLKLDLMVIISIQILAFIYGIYSLEQGRPAWIVYSVDRFELIRKNDLIKNNIQQALPEFQKVPILHPKFATLEFAKDISKRNDDMFAEVFTRISLSQRPELYMSFDLVQIVKQARWKSIRELKSYNDPSLVDKILVNYSNANAYYPLKANAVDMVVLIDKEKAEVIKIVDLRPWN